MKPTIFRRWTILGALALAGAGLAGGAFVHASHAARAAVAAVPPVHYQPIRWVKLMPEAWLKRFRELDYGQMNDGNPRVQELLNAVETTWDTAPTVPEMNNVNVKLPGYVVPLEETRGELKEFLLVPYLGACIHTPPPPANQIVHVRSREPVKGVHAMDIVSISGMLKVASQSTSMGTSGYSMDAALVEPYIAPARNTDPKASSAQAQAAANKRSS